MAPPTLGEFLRSLRLQRNLTQSTLAQRADVVVKTISQIENDDGQRGPHRATLARLVDVLRASKELTRSERTFVSEFLDEEYSWDSQLAPDALTWEMVLEDGPRSYKGWIKHCVAEMTQVLGREEMLYLLLTTARTKGIDIPVTPSE